MIPLFKVFMSDKVDGPLLETLHSGFIGQGSKVEQFESILKVYVDNPYILTINTGTSAIQLALRLAGVGPGDDVITSPMTCTASNMPILAAGANIVWADIDPETGNISPQSIIDNLTERTKAVICIHYGGYPCDLDEINNIGKAFRIKIIEDAAHAFGSEYRGRLIGNHSDFACFSFQAIKTMTTVDGGLLACNNEFDYRRGKLLRWYGIDREGPRADFRCENDIPEWGYKFHMNDVAATIGMENFKALKILLACNRRNARYYDNEIGRRGLRRVKKLRYDNDRLSSYWLYILLVEDRASFMAHMADRGIQVSQVHKRNDTHSCFAQFNDGPLPGVDSFSSRQCAIPVGWWLSHDERVTIMDAVEEWEKQ